MAVENAGVPSGKALLQFSAKDGRSTPLGQGLRTESAALIAGLNEKLQRGCLDTIAIKKLLLTSDGYEETKKLCCITSMMEFIRRMIAETLQMEVCDESALAGLALWHHCGDAKGSSQNFASLMSQIKAGSPAHVWPCPWVANVGSCPNILEDERRNCVGFPGATLPPCNEIATLHTTTL